MSKYSDPSHHKVAAVSTAAIVELAADAPPRGRRKRRGRFLIILLLLLLAAVWAAPIFIAKTSMRNSVLAWATSDLNGSLTAESASLGWFSPIVADGIEIKDDHGDRILHIEQLVGDRSLARIAMNFSEVGRFKITKPVVLVEMTDADSNWEKVLEKYLAPSDEPSAQVGVAVEVVDGQIELRDKTADRVFVIEKLNVNATVPSSTNEAINATLSGEFAQQGAHPTFKATCNLLLPSAENAGDCSVEMDCDRIPLAAFRPLAGRVASQTDLRGALSGPLNARAQFTGAALAKLDLTSGLAVENFDLAGPFADNERLQLARVELPCRVSTEGSRVLIHQLRLATDVGSLDGQGAIDDPSKWTAEMSMADMLDSALRTEGAIAANVDLARLARLLPETFSIHPGLEITSGAAKLSHANRRAPTGWTWETKLETTSLAAREGGRDFSWDAPVTASAIAHEAGGAAIVDRVTCDSSFLKIEGKGDANQFALQGAYNLNELFGKVSQFADLGGMRLAGSGNGGVDWRRTPNGGITANLATTLNNFTLERPGATPWTETQLDIKAAAAGQYLDGVLARIDSANCTVVSGPDRLIVKTTAPVQSPAATSQWPLNLELVGDAGRWLTRAQPWLGVEALADARLTGALDVKAVALGNAETIDIKSLDLNAKNLQGVVAGIPIDEETLKLIGSAQWSTPAMRFTSPELFLTSRTVSAKLKKATVAIPEVGSPSALGSLEWGLDLARAQRWWNDPAAPSYQFAGLYRGVGNIEQAGDLVKWNLDSEAKDLVIVPLGADPWKEPLARLTTQGAYDTVKDGVAIDKLTLEAKAAVIKLAGQISEVSGRRNANIKGSMRYDLATVSAMLGPHTGNRVRLVGNDERAFELVGPLGATAAAAPDDSLAMLRDVSAKSAFGWREATVFGVQMGKADFFGTLAGGVAKIDPLTFPVSSGKVTLGTTARLTPGPIELTLPPGKLAENIEVTQEISNQALMYIAPVLANAAQVQGKFSIDLDQNARIPVNDPQSSDIAGRLLIHSIEIAPSPLLQELSTLLSLTPLRTMKLKKESTVPFRLTQRRVFHDNLELPFEEFTIRTRGSVGLDQSLSMIAEMPVPPKWLGSGAVADTLRNQTIQLPIGGTISRPRIDPAAVNHLASRFVRDAAGAALQNQINRGLDKIFKPLGTK